MLKFYNSERFFKLRTHQDVPGWGQAITAISCPICEGPASVYKIKDEPIRGSCSQCYSRFIQLKKIWHAFVPVFMRSYVEEIHGHVNWQKSPFTKPKKSGIINAFDTLSSTSTMEELEMAFTTKVTIAFADGELSEEFTADNRKASTRNARRWIRNQGVSIKDGEQAEKGKTQLIVTIASEDNMPQPVAEDEEDNEES